MSVIREMLQNLLSKPFTIRYPAEKAPVPAAFRGKVCIDDERCIGCGKCSTVCPAQCIAMTDNPREVMFRDKTMKRKKKPQVKLYKCIRCGLCERHCPADAIHLRPVLSETGTDREVVLT